MRRNVRVKAADPESLPPANFRLEREIRGGAPRPSRPWRCPTTAGAGNLGAVPASGPPSESKVVSCPENEGF